LPIWITYGQGEVPRTFARVIVAHPARRKLNAQRASNAETRDVNRGRRQELDLRMWRNNMRKTLLVKGG
jgi:hypothetical protein